MLFRSDEGAICRQAEKATTTKYNTYVKQISTLLVSKRDKCRAISLKDKHTQEQQTFFSRVLMQQSITSPKGQTYNNETYILMSIR